LIEQLEFWVQGIFRPDLTLLLDAPINIGLSRVKERAVSDRFEQEQLSFFEQVRQAYLLQAKKNPDRIYVINANQSITAVQSDMVNHVLTLLKK